MTPTQMLALERQFDFMYQSRNAAEHKIVPKTSRYHRQFSDAAFYSFRAYSRKSLYALLYGSFSENMTWNDFFNCYLMGGEL